MRVTYDFQPRDHAEACNTLADLCEGVVRAMVEEIDSFPDDTFPCCIKCANFCTRNGPMAPAQRRAIAFHVVDHDEETPWHESAMQGEMLRNDDEPANPEDPDATYPYGACTPRNCLGHRAPGPFAELRIRSASQILASGGGTTIELACYQAAQKRRHADPLAKVEVLCTEPGTFRAIVRCSHEHEKPERRGAIDDPIVDARPVGSCGCAREVIDDAQDG